MSTQYVRSKWNPQAKDEEKLKVRDVNEHYYQCVDNIHGYIPYLLKAHYVPCEAQVVWRDVTSEIEYDDHSKFSHLKHNGKYVFHGQYRLRKVAVPNHGSGTSQYFIVEQKQS